MLFNPSGDVADQTGQLLQQQFEDWQKTFQPIELAALDQISFNNTSVLPTALDEAKKGTSASYGAMAGVLERQNKGLGIAPTPQQSATNNRILNLSQGAATAGAENSVRSNTRQLDDMLLTGAAVNPNIAKATPGVQQQN